MSTQKEEDEWAGPNLIIEGIGTDLPDTKRCFVSGVVIKSHCPGCGEEFERDLGEHYLPYGQLPESWRCEWEEDIAPYRTLGCGNEWRTPMRVEIHFLPDEEDED